MFEEALKPSCQLAVELCELLGHLLHVSSLGVGDARSAVGKAEGGITGRRAVVQVFVDAAAGEGAGVRRLAAEDRGRGMCFPGGWSENHGREVSSRAKGRGRDGTYRTLRLATG